MVALENVKSHFFSIRASVQAAGGRDEALRDIVSDIIIMGNPGTGNLSAISKRFCCISMEEASHVASIPLNSSDTY